MQLRMVAFVCAYSFGQQRWRRRLPTPIPTQPDFSIVVQGTFDAETLAEFNRRVQDYAALRARLEVGLPPLVVTTTLTTSSGLNTGSQSGFAMHAAPDEGSCLFPRWRAR